MAQKVLLFSFVLAISTLLVMVSLIGIYGVFSTIRNASLNGSLLENIKAFFVSRRLKLRYKGLAAHRVTRKDGESGVSTYTHNKGGCNAFLYRGITRVKGLICKGSSLRLGGSVFYCPRCEIIVGSMSESNNPEPAEEARKGPLGIVR